MGTGGVKRKTVTANQENPELVQALQADKAKKDIEKLTAELKDPRWELYQRSINLGRLEIGRAHVLTPVT